MASWLDPRRRQARLMKKHDLQAMPHVVHKMEEHVVAKMRWEGCAFIRRVGENLRMFKPALSSACVFFARFYARNGFLDKKPSAWADSEWQEWSNAQLPSRFKDLHWRFVAISCLFLAGKVEDNPKKIYDVVIQFHKEVPKHEKLVDPELSDGHIRQLKETLFAYERLVLQDLEFDMIVEAPIAFNQVAQHIKFMRMSLSNATKLPSGNLSQALATNIEQSLDADGLQMLRLALDFVEHSVVTTLWLEYDAPTIAFGIAWLTAKFYNFAPKFAGSWWRLMNDHFEDLNKREDPHTGSIFRLKAPPQNILDDIGLQLIAHHAEAFARDKPLLPRLPQLSSGHLPGEDGEQGSGQGGSSMSENPFKWRHVCLVGQNVEGGRVTSASAASLRAPPSVLTREGPILRCTCQVWKALEASNVPERKRTCRCLMSFNGIEAERLRVGEEHAETFQRLVSLQHRTKRHKT